MSPSWKVFFERPGISSTYLRPSAERGRTDSVESTDSGSIFLSRLRSSTAMARSLPFDRLPRARDVLDDPDAEAARAHLVALHELGAVRHLGLQLVGGHERQAVVRLVRDEHGDDRDQHRHRADQDRARARAVGCRALTGRGGSRGRRWSSDGVVGADPGEVRRRRDCGGRARSGRGRRGRGGGRPPRLPTAVGSGVVTPGCVGPRNWLHWAIRSRARLHLVRPSTGSRRCSAAARGRCRRAGCVDSVCQ